MTRFLLVLGMLALGACASAPGGSGNYAREQTSRAVGPDCQAEKSIASSAQMDVIQRMLDSQRPRAALAYLDALPPTDQGRPVPRYLRAEVNRRIGQPAVAEPIYRQLLPTCMGGFAYRGLGLIAAARGDLPTAIRSLEQARMREPVDADIRNDLGYAYIRAGNLDAAYDALATALELQSDHRRAALNMVLLTVVRGQQREAWDLAKSLKIDRAQFEAVQAKAAVLTGGASPSGRSGSDAGDNRLVAPKPPVGVMTRPDAPPAPAVEHRRAPPPALPARVPRVAPAALASAVTTWKNSVPAAIAPAEAASRDLAAGSTQKLTQATAKKTNFGSDWWSDLRFQAPLELDSQAAEVAPPFPAPLGFGRASPPVPTKLPLAEEHNP